MKRFFTGAATIKSLNKTLCEQNHALLMCVAEVAAGAAQRDEVEKLKKQMKQGIEAQRRQHEQEIGALKAQLPTLIDAAIQARHGLEITLYLVSYSVGCAVRALRHIRFKILQRLSMPPHAGAPPRGGAHGTRGVQLVTALLRAFISVYHSRIEDTVAHVGVGSPARVMYATNQWSNNASYYYEASKRYPNEV